MNKRIWSGLAICLSLPGGFQAVEAQERVVDHTSLTYQHQGPDFRLTDVHGEVVQGVLG